MRRLHLPIHDPCHEDWDAMDRDGDARRFCDVCTKQVHDLSALTEGQAREVLGEEFAKGRVCVRYKTDATGNIKFQPEPGTLAYAPSAWRSMLAAAGMGLMLMTGCVDASPERVNSDHCVFEIGPWSFTTARGQGRCPAEEPEMLGEIEIAEPEPPMMGEPMMVEPPPEEPPMKGEIAEPPEPEMIQGEIEPVRELKGKVAPPLEPKKDPELDPDPEIELLGNVALTPEELARIQEPCDSAAKPDSPK